MSCFCFTPVALSTLASSKITITFSYYYLLTPPSVGYSAFLKHFIQIELKEHNFEEADRVNVGP